MNRKPICLIIIAITLITLSIIASSLTADDMKNLRGMRFVQLARGGLLYDNWPVELGIEVNKTHPSYPSFGRAKGKSTWRCKECHGWDYRGKDGAYAEVSHFTGIKGIRSHYRKNPDEIIKILKDKTHAFGDMLSKDNYDALALFVSIGQIDMDLYIDRKTKKSIGDFANGGRIFLATCTKCHGADGKDINMGDEKQPVYIGTEANKNPWEVLHKIRWGHPREPMVSLVFLSLKEQIDVLAFCQALPQE